VAQNFPPISAGQFSRLQMQLRNYGVSPAGASQFMSGLPVLEPGDRRALLLAIAHVGLQAGVAYPAIDGASKDAATLSTPRLNRPEVEFRGRRR
jgi:hypothetical protein